MRTTYPSFKRCLFTLFILSSVGCDNFYSYYAEEDLYRLPLIEPYRLTNLYGVDKTTIGEPLRQPERDEFFSWNLEFRQLEFKPSVKIQTWVNKVNVTKGIIYGYGSSRGDLPNEWFVVIPSQNIEKLFKDLIAWQNYLAERGVKSFNVYDIWPIFQKFKATETLPWYNPKENIFPSKP